jgi:hypothetical protein
MSTPERGRIALRSAVAYRVPLRLRLPFRYGITTLTEVTHAVLHATYEIDGVVVSGWAADNLAPKWFRKDPAQPIADELVEMDAVIAAAFGHARVITAPDAFRFWQQLHEMQAAWAESRGIPPLLAHLGTSLVERTLLHALSRRHGVTTSVLLRENLAHVDLGALRPELAGSTPRDWLPARPEATVWARHTVGMADPLDAADVVAGERLDDGLPQTLVENIRRYGLRHFKLKASGELVRDRERLERILALLEREVGSDYAFSIDGNESFHGAAEFFAYARALHDSPGLRAAWSRLLFFEQPWHREVALSPAIAAAARAWPDLPPVIIDESDATPASLPSALALGYAGTSHKNCKGVIKGLVNACTLAHRRAVGQRVVLSGEDLTNVGPVALTQDLAVAAALGITSIERNGHHYFAGLSQFPPAWQAQALRDQPRLFVADARVAARLDISDGRLCLDALNRASLGVPADLDCRGLVAVPLA